MDLEKTITYTISENESLTMFRYSDITLKPIVSPNDIMTHQVGKVEGFFDVEYPVRKNFLKEYHNAVGYEIETKFPYLYTAFEGESVNLSSFLTTPHHLEGWANTYLQAEKPISAHFELKTCGGVKIWVNQKLQAEHQPFTRNHPSAKPITLTLEEGINEVRVYFEELAERDTVYSFQLIYHGQEKLAGFIPVGYEPLFYQDAVSYLSSLAPKKDRFTAGAISIVSSLPTVPYWIKKLRIRINPKQFLANEEMQDGNISEFKVDDFYREIRGQELLIGQVENFLAAGMTTCELAVEMQDGSYINRNLVFTVYHEEKFKGIIKGKTLQERKKEALEYFASLDLEDVNVGIIKLLLGQPLAKKKDEKYSEFQSALALIEGKGDCADFVLAPMLAFSLMHPQKVPNDLNADFKKAVLDFRYWIDEPGNDVMWYFSENHALLFHAAQYLAGSLYPEERFTNSGRCAKDTVKVGKARLLDWFEDFFNYGFSEWNSITYLPIDLIGFFSLYLAAPDQEIKTISKKAIDMTFELISIHHHHGMMSSTYGRVYEHNLKPLPLGEITNLTKIAWGEGCFNNALRASALFAISDYEPHPSLLEFAQIGIDESLTAQYIQGVNKAQTYQFKTYDYSLSSVINYLPYEEGYQQHVLNISLGQSNTQFWLNHPGERKFSGENRPSYWAGNGTMPLLFQYKNTAMLHYRLIKGQIDYLHLYLPFWELDQVKQIGNWLFLQKGTGYTAVYFSNGLEFTNEGAVAGREVRSYGEEHFIIIKCGSASESKTFDFFIQDITASRLEAGIHFSWDDFQYGKLEIKNKKLWLCGQEVNYHDTYEKSLIKEKRRAN